MSAGADVVVLETVELLAAAAAARFVTALVDAQAASGVASVVLTGGRVGGAVLRAVRDSPARDAVDWSRVEIWWGDERWVPIGDPERNDRQAQDALLAEVPVDPARVHPFPAAGGHFAGDPDAAAVAYADELAAAGPARFDVLLLGVGEEGHVASIFPDSPARARDPDGRRLGARLPETAPDPPHADLPRHQQGHRGVADGGGLGEGRRRRPGPGRRHRPGGAGGRRPRQRPHPLAARHRGRLQTPELSRPPAG